MASLENRLDDAINRILAGEQIAEQDPDLRPLLQSGVSLLAARPPAPAHPQAHARMMAALEEARRRRRPFWAIFLAPFQHLRWPRLQPLRLLPAVATIAVIVAIVLSQSALPGQAHYPLKRGLEAARFLFLRQPDQQAAY
ncbi:MAG: hypothetical protein D6775_03885, partial [Caldilineae bacterium]